MRDQEMQKDLPVTGRTEWNTGSIEIEQSIAAMVAKTRQDWTSLGPASPLTAGAGANRVVLVHPYFRKVSGAKDYAIANGRGRPAMLNVKRVNIFESQE